MPHSQLSDVQRRSAI